MLRSDGVQSLAKERTRLGGSALRAGASRLQRSRGHISGLLRAARHGSCRARGRLRQPAVPGILSHHRRGGLADQAARQSDQAAEGQPSVERRLRENAGQLPIESPNDRWPLRFIASQLFVLRPLDRGNSLILRYAACNRLLNGVTDIHQHLSIT
jgi:hypothetical protein